MQLWRSRRRLVRVHQLDGPTVEGVLVERPSPGNSWSYVVAKASLLEAEGVTTPLAGEWEIQQGRVLFVERMARSGA